MHGKGLLVCWTAALIALSGLVQAATLDGLRQDRTIRSLTNSLWSKPSPGWTPTGTTPPPSPASTGSLKQKLVAFMINVASSGKVISGQMSYGDNASFDADTSAFGFALGMMLNDPFMRQWANGYTY